MGERFLLKDSVGVDNWPKYLNEMTQHGRTWGGRHRSRLARLVAWPAALALTRRRSRPHMPAPSDPGPWTLADEATLLEMSVLFRAEICVISSLSEDYCHVVTPPDVWKVELRTRIYLGHFAEYHYVSTRPI